MFFKKKTSNETPIPNPPKPEYSAELDALRDSFPVAINLNAFDGHQVLSIERDNLNLPTEETVVFVMYKNSTTAEEYPFKISRKEHSNLVNDFNKKTQTADPL